MIKSTLDVISYATLYTHARDRDCAASLDLMGGARFCELLGTTRTVQRSSHWASFGTADRLRPEGSKSSEAKSGSAQQQLIYSIIGTSFCSNGYS